MRKPFPKCKDCKKKLGDYRSIRCKSCMHKGKLSYLYKNGKGCEPTKCITCGKITARHSKQCKKCSNKLRRIGMKHTEQSKIKMSKAICKHHLDMNQNNNQEINFLYLNKANHQKIHRFMYDYIVKVKKDFKLLKSYVKWFKQNYLNKEIKND